MIAPMLACCLLPVLLSAPLPQQPAPAGEGRATCWSAAEGRTLATMQAILQRAAKSESGNFELGGRVLQLDGYDLGIAVADADGNPVLAKQLDRKQVAFALAWPRHVGGDTNRALLVHSDGTALFCQPDGADLPAFDLTLALAKGSKGTFADALRQPGTGGSGDLWMLLVQAAQKRAVQVVDDQGRPRRDVTVAVGGGIGLDSGRDGVALPKPWPIATGTSDDHGVAWLSGPLCEATVAVLTTKDRRVVGQRIRVEDDVAGLRFVVPDAALQPKLDARANANEAAAIATLKNLSSAQAQCQACAVIDANRNGAGEYGFFAELSGAEAVRSDGKGGLGTQKLNPPVLSAAFAKVQAGRVVRSGYVFQVFLPDQKGNAVAEAPTGGAKAIAVDPTRAEVLWCAYAWPVTASSGQRAFFVNQNGDILATDNLAGSYVGNDQPVPPDAAFAAGSTGTLDSKVAANQQGRDGQRWIVVQ